MTTPYASATSGMKARDEIAKVLRRLGCEKLGPAALQDSSASSGGDRRMRIAVTFSSRCATDDVPGIGRVMGERASNHAMAI